MATDIKVVKTVFSVDSTDIDEAKVKYNGLTTSIEKATIALKNQSTDAKTSVADLNKSINSVINRTNLLQSEYQKISNQASKTFDPKTLDIYKQKMQALQSEAKELGVKLTDTNKQTDKLKSGISGIGSVIAGAFAIGSIVAFGKSVIDITSQVQKYRAVLTNTLGSQNLADMAMGMISDTAIKTNFSVMELTDTYIKFANRGLNLTSSEMMKLADIANSTGKSIDQLTEATLDAFTGENERLKEFGITAKKTGETTQYTFKGVTTEVKNTQEAIKGYLLGLGELEGVMGSTNAISQTLGGQISNLGDKWDKLLISLGNQTTGVINGVVEGFSKVIDILTLLGKTSDDYVNDVANALSKDVSKEVQKQYDRALQIGKDANKTKQQILDEELANETKTRQAVLEAQKEDLLILEEKERAYNDNSKERFKDRLTFNAVARQRELDTDIEVKKGEIKATQTFLDTLIAEHKNYSKKYEEVKKVESDKERKARELAQKKIVDDAINLLQHEEKIAKQKALNVGANTTDILMIEDEFNYKRIQIYNEYSKILNNKQKQDQETAIVNVDTIANKIVESDLKLIEERKKANEEWSKKTQDSHEKNEQDLEKHLDRIASIEQNKIGLKKDAELTKMYEDGNLTVKEKLQKRQEIEDYYNNWSATQQIESDEIKLKSLKLNSEDYIALERKIADEKVALNKEANDKIVEDDKATAEKRKEVIKQGLDLLQEGINGIYSYKKNVNDQELIDLKDKEERELKLAGDNQAKKEAIAKKYEALQAEVRRKQFEQNKQIALINVAINTAEGIQKAVALSPATFGLPFSAFVGASGLIQASLINSQPTPKFAKGVIDLQGKGTGTSDEIHAMLSKGESVMTAEETTRFKPLLQSIRRKELSPELANMMLNGQKMSNINLNTDSLARELRGMPKNHISIDKDGFKTFLYSENLKQESLNNRYLS